MLKPSKISFAYSDSARSAACLAVLLAAGLATILDATCAAPALADLRYRVPDSKVQIAALDRSATTAPLKSGPGQSPLSNPLAAAPAINPLTSGDPFPLSSKFSRRLQRYSGVNWLGAALASQAAGFVVHHKIGGKVKVHLKTYSFTDLLAGKLKSVSIEVKDPKLSGIGLGAVSIKSAGPIWYAYRKPKAGESRGLKSAVMLSVRASLSQKQIARALENPSVASKLHGLKLDLPGLGEQQLEVLSPKVEILDDLLKLEGTLVTRGGTVESGVPVTISARPKLVGDSQIVLEQLKVDSADIVDPAKFSDFTAKLLNPVVDFARMDRRDHAFRLDTLKVSGRQGDVEGNGRLLLVPRLQPSASQLAGTGNLIR
ncbi:MAG: hypothetical protein KGS72_06420 [Cyanobacteria bacterium REEB67]|nr:hypothetical protein [Cyanobacteria bacterium REEB67]